MIIIIILQLLLHGIFFARKYNLKANSCIIIFNERKKIDLVQTVKGVWKHMLTIFRLRRWFRKFKNRDKLMKLWIACSFCVVKLQLYLNRNGPFTEIKWQSCLIMMMMMTQNQINYKHSLLLEFHSFFEFFKWMRKIDFPIKRVEYENMYDWLLLKCEKNTTLRSSQFTRCTNACVRVCTYTSLVYDAHRRI